MSTLDLKAAHDELQEALKALDDRLDAATGDAETVGRRKVTDELIEASQQAWTPIADSLVNQLNNASEPVRIGVYYGLIRKLQKDFGEPISKLVDAMVEAMPKPEKLEVSEDVLKEMLESRAALYKKLTTLIEMAESFDQAEGMTMPPKRRANKGAKTGPRAISFVEWSIDDKDYKDLTEVIKDYDQFSKTVELRKAMTEKGIDLKKPPARFEFTMPDGKVLVGINTRPDVTDKMAEETETEEEGEENE